MVSGYQSEVSSAPASFLRLAPAHVDMALSITALTRNHAVHVLIQVPSRRVPHQLCVRGDVADGGGSADVMTYFSRVKKRVD